MADHKDQSTDPHEEDPTFIPLTKTSMAEKSLPGSNEPHVSSPQLDSSSSYSDSSDDEETRDELTEEVKKQKLNEFKRRAFYSVLLAFRAETMSLGNKRDKIIEKLMNELSVGQETRISFEDNIQKNLVAQQQRVDSNVKETKPLTIRLPAKKSLWGKVDPVALLGRRVLVKMPEEEDYEELVISEFNAKDGMHRLATVDSNVMWLDETCSWMDVRKVPAEDIIWISGEEPDFETPGQ